MRPVKTQRACHVVPIRAIFTEKQLLEKMFRTDQLRTIRKEEDWCCAQQLSIFIRRVREPAYD